MFSLLRDIRRARYFTKSAGHVIKIWSGAETTYKAATDEDPFTHLLMTSQPLMRYFMELGRKVGEVWEAKAFRKSGIR